MKPRYRTYEETIEERRPVDESVTLGYLIFGVLWCVGLMTLFLYWTPKITMWAWEKIQSEPEVEQIGVTNFYSYPDRDHYFCTPTGGCKGRHGPPPDFGYYSEYRKCTAFEYLKESDWEGVVYDDSDIFWCRERAELGI